MSGRSGLPSRSLGLQPGTGPGCGGGDGGPDWSIVLAANCSKGMYRESRRWAEAGILGHSAMESASFQWTWAGGLLSTL